MGVGAVATDVGAGFGGSGIAVGIDLSRLAASIDRKARGAETLSRGRGARSCGSVGGDTRFGWAAVVTEGCETTWRVLCVAGAGRAGCAVVDGVLTRKRCVAADCAVGGGFDN